MKNLLLPTVIALLLAPGAFPADKSKSQLAPRAARELAPASAPAVSVALDVSNAGPREIEDTTQKAIIRDYGNAWAIMARALSEGRADQLPAAFVGDAQQQLAERVRQQKQSGLRTRLVDRGHKLEALFYSPEGSAMQLRDTAQLEMQLLDGDTVVHQEPVTLHSVVLMTVAEDRWKVRAIEGVPGF